MSFNSMICGCDCHKVTLVEKSLAKTFCEHCNEAVRDAVAEAEKDHPHHKPEKVMTVKNQTGRELTNKDVDRILEQSEINLFADRQDGSKEWKQDLETEKLINGKNIHTILKVCPTHRISCPMPLEYECVDCKLYMSGADIRSLLSQQKASILSALTLEKKSLIDDKTRIVDDVIYHNAREYIFGYNQAIDDLNKKKE